MSDDRRRPPRRPNHPNAYFVVLALYKDVLKAFDLAVPSRQELTVEASKLWKGSPPEFRDKFTADAKAIRDVEYRRLLAIPHEDHSSQHSPAGAKANRNSKFGKGTISFT